MTVRSSQPFEAILAHPREWRQLGRGAIMLFAAYAGLMTAIVQLAVNARPLPKPIPKRLMVTLFDAPKLNTRELGKAGGENATASGGNESTGRLVKIADPRLARPAPRIKPKAETAPKALSGEEAKESQRAGKDPLPVTPRTVENESAASSAPAVIASSTSEVGSKELGASGAQGGMGGAGKGEGSGKGGTGFGTGSGAQAGLVSGETRVLPFMDGMTRPELLSKVDPQYTREARDANVQGLILAKCVISTAGALQRCRIVKGIPLMDQAVLSALAHWRYSPVLYQGKPATVEYLIPVRLVAP